MKKYFIIICYWIIFSNDLKAQQSTFSNRYPYFNYNSNFTSVLEFENKFYAVGALFNPSTFTDDGYIVCIDKNGNKKFSKFQREIDSISLFLILDNINFYGTDIYVSGKVARYDTNYVRGFTQDPFLIKYDTLGNVIWYRNDYRTSNRYFYTSTDLVFVRNSFIHLGNTVYEDAQGNGISQNPVIFWIDTAGNVIDQKEYNLASNEKFEYAQDFEPLADGGFLLSGQLSNGGSGGNRNGFLARMDSLGNKIWFKSYGEAGRLEDFYTSTILKDGNYLACGWRARDEFPTGINSAWDAWLVKVNSLNGDTIWTQTVNAAYYNRFTRAIEQSNGDLIIGGEGGNADSANADAQIMRLDSLGNKLWVKRYGWPFDTITFNTSAENIYDFIKTSDGGYMIVGDARGYNTPTPQQSGWLLKLDSNGCLVAGCGSVGIVEFEVFSTLIFKAYPNPAQDEVTISGELQDGDIITFFDFTGKLLEQRSINSSELPTFDVSNYANGIYLLQLYRSGYNKTMQKLMIAR